MDRSMETLAMTTPIGELELVAQAGELVEIHMGRRAEPDGRAAEGPRRPLAGDPTRHDTSLAVLHETRRQLRDYFACKSASFALPTRRSGTDFQLAVWDALGEVGYGETVTYGELAARIGRPSAARAVGQALARNPLPIVVPCHRVVGHLGELPGFGGGLDRKRLLLELEKARGSTPLSAPAEAQPSSSAASRTGPR